MRLSKRAFSTRQAAISRLFRKISIPGCFVLSHRGLIARPCPFVIFLCQLSVEYAPATLLAQHLLNIALGEKFLSTRIGPFPVSVRDKK